MASAGQTRVTPLQEGDLFATKQMEGRAGASFPEHRASVESVLVVTEGQCLFRLAGAEHRLRTGDSLVVPADVWHQIIADQDFKAIHVMPKEIRFEFSR